MFIATKHKSLTMIYYLKTSKSKDYLPLKYKFVKMNIEYNIDELAPKIWTAKMYYVLKLIHTMKKDNEINFDYLWLPEWTIKKLRPLFIKTWIVWKHKLSDDWVAKYYLNPYYAHQTKKIDKELFDAFDKVNGWKIY